MKYFAKPKKLKHWAFGLSNRLNLLIALCIISTPEIATVIICNYAPISIIETSVFWCICGFSWILFLLIGTIYVSETVSMGRLLK